MPTRLRDLVPDLLDLGGDVAGNLLSRRTSSNAGNALRTGIDAAGRRITDASRTGIDLERDALARQEGLYRDRRNILTGGLDRQEDLYNERRGDYEPYAEGGREGVTALRRMVEQDEQFDPRKAMENPAYKVGLDEGVKGVGRFLSAKGTLNSGQEKDFIRFAYDYATKGIRDEYDRFSTDRAARLAEINSLTGVGERAAAGQSGVSRDFGDQIGNTAARESDAAGEFGDQIGRSATNRSALTLAEAQALADLELSRGEVGANQAVQGGNANGRLVNGLVDTGGSLLRRALGGGAAAAGAAGSVGNILGLGAGATTLGTGSSVTGMTLPQLAAEYGSTAGGGAGNAVLGFLSNPVTLGIGAALAVGGILLRRSQAHPEADKLVQTWENPWHQNFLAPFAAQWDQAIKSGQITPQQGSDALATYLTEYENYLNKIEDWAGSDDDKQLVARQSAENLWSTTVGPQVRRMQGEIAQLGAA